VVLSPGLRQDAPDKTRGDNNMNANTGLLVILSMIVLMVIGLLTLRPIRLRVH
jgi:hypothetical protein